MWKSNLKSYLLFFNDDDAFSTRHVEYHIYTSSDIFINFFYMSVQFQFLPLSRFIQTAKITIYRTLNGRQYTAPITIPRKVKTSICFRIGHILGPSRILQNSTYTNTEHLRSTTLPTCNTQSTSQFLYQEQQKALRDFCHFQVGLSSPLQSRHTFYGVSVFQDQK